MAAFAAEKDTRICINGVHVESHKSNLVLVATDGAAIAAHKLGLVYDGPEFLIPTRAINGIKGEEEEEEVEITAEFTASTQKITVAGKTYEGPISIFMPWRNVIPNTLSGEMATFDPARLAKLCKALKISTNFQHLALNGDKPAQIINHGIPGLIAFILPLHFKPTHKLYVKPDWS